MAKRKRRENRVDRRRRELAERQQRAADTKKVLIPIVFIAIIVIVAFLLLKGGDDAGYEPTDTANVGDSGSVEIVESDVTDQAKYYTHKAKGTEVRFFAVRGTDGEVRVAFDACDVCYSEKKGYRQVGTEMKCNNCGNQYGYDDLGTKNIRGGCWPSYLPRDITGGKVVVDIKDLENKAYMFK
jgi:uncharacterized membrane protein